MSSPPVELELERTFRPLTASGRAPLRVLVAFSGGPDSSALLAGLTAVAPRLALEVCAAHLDHGLDADSARRARDARCLAARLGIALAVGRLAAHERHDGQGAEAAAREARYAFLERQADEVGADLVATAHHADDQAETVLLRLLYGSGLAGLAGIAVRRGRLVRPLLTLRRRQLRDGLGPRLAPLFPVADPTNDDLAAARNRVRHVLLPRLEERWPDVVERLCSLAAAAADAARRVDALLAARLAPRPLPGEPLPGEPGVAVDRAAFDALPQALVPHALALLHRRAGAPFPATAAARGELGRQLRSNSGGRAGCDCGGGWRWEAASGLLHLARREPSRPEFTYTLDVPGEVEIPEIGLRFRLCRGRVASWMFTARPDRAGLAAGEERCRIEVRNRRPGDRFTPLGSGHRRRLKDLLIDRRVPRRQRDRLPLLVVDGEIAWVPGVTIAERFRLAPSSGRWAWIAEIETLEGAAG